MSSAQSSMEVEFWRFLCSDVVSLKQRIPEVALFRKCNFEGWFTSGKKGLMVKKPQRENDVRKFLQCCIDIAEERERKRNAAGGAPSVAAASAGGGADANAPIAGMT